MIRPAVSDNDSATLPEFAHANVLGLYNIEAVFAQTRHDFGRNAFIGEKCWHDHSAATKPSCDK
jgi:hypothetical protein